MALRADDRHIFREWLTSAVGASQPLIVIGDAHSGKSAMIRTLADEMDDTILLDCASVTADDVARRLVARTGGDITPGGRRWPRHILHTQVTGDHFLLLTNVQWAGALATSSEPSRIAKDLVRSLSRAPRASVRMVVEWDAEILGPPPAFSTAISLEATDAAGPAAPATVDASTGAQEIRALACSELPVTPLSVWRLLFSAMYPHERTPTTSELLSMARSLPEVLDCRDASPADSGISFRDLSVKHRLRRLPDIRGRQQARIADLLIQEMGPTHTGQAWAELGETGRYATEALAIHAARSGVHRDMLTHGSLLANTRPASLWEALRIAYPGGVPSGSMAADVRALECQGVQPADQGEWVSWLHHVALNSDRADIARQLLMSGVPASWQTVWSRWRPNGTFGNHDGEAGRVDELVLREEASVGLTVRTARDTTTGKATFPEHSYVLREWELATGNPAGEETVVSESLDEADWTIDERAPDHVPAVFATHSPAGWLTEDKTVPPPPRMPAAVKHGVRVDDLWVLAGDGGVFAIAAPSSGPDEQPRSWLPEPLVSAHLDLAVPPLRADARAAVAGDPSSRLWFERGFGIGSCRPLSGHDLPPGLNDVRARDFLTTIGLPLVSGFLNLRTRDVFEDGLPAVPWPHDAKVSSPGSTGPFFDIGVWMHSRLLLDGETGQVLRDTTHGPDTVLASGSLHQFFTMVRLFDEHRKSLYPSRAERQDWHHIVREWCRAVDPVALTGEVWEIALGPYDFADSTWDLVSPEGRYP